MDYPKTGSQDADKEYIRQNMSEKLLERDEEADLAIAWRENGDEKAMHALIRAYMRLVISSAHKYKHYGIPVSDLVQEGSLGLLQAAKRFEPEKGFRFSTYAKWWIRAFIQEYILRNWSIVRTGSTTSHKQLFFHLRRLKNQLFSLTDCGMDQEQKETIAETLNVSIRDVTDMEERLTLYDFSLSAPVSSSSENDFQNLLEDEGLSPEEVSVNHNTQSGQREWIERAMEELNPRERYVILHRHLSATPKTLEAIGKHLKVTKERIRQIEMRAIRKMRFQLMDGVREIRQTLEDQ